MSDIIWSILYGYYMDFIVISLAYAPFVLEGFGQ